MLAICDAEDGCKKEFTLEKFEVEKLDNDIEKTYFKCPHCNKKYVAFYTDKEIRRKQKFIRNVKDNKKFDKLKDEIGKDMKRLRKKIETLN